MQVAGPAIASTKNGLPSAAQAVEENRAAKIRYELATFDMSGLIVRSFESPEKKVTRIQPTTTNPFQATAQLKTPLLFAT